VQSAVFLRRRKTRQVKVGDVLIGGDAPVTVQTMTKTKTEDVDATVQQIYDVTKARCDIVRCAVPNEKAARSLGDIRVQIQIPLVADIHFNAKFAMIAIEQGVDKLRLNPGNIRSEAKVRDICAAAKERGIPIRIGVNAGSLDPDIKEKWGMTPEALVESAKKELSWFDKAGFEDVVVSLKASDPLTCIKAYELFSKQFDFPLHLGITEAGLPRDGTVRSAMGMGVMLYQGIGDTLRVSLTGEPVEECEVGWAILESFCLRQRGPKIIACPSCGRADIDIVALAEKVKDRTKHLTKNIQIAVMGCEVNGPGEAKAADVGLSGGKNCGLITLNGEILEKVSEEAMLDALMAQIEAMPDPAEQAAS
jgi:(E)-4-hydroxy-3-methylbut-2-enyl-diphosphate synthase